jgi:predicted helicase
MVGVTNIESYLTKTSYFPFDERWCIYNKAVIDRTRRELIQHVYNRNNICLNVVRQTKQQEWRHALVSALPTTPLYIETKDGSYVFPIFLYPRHANDNASDDRNENLSANFRNFIDDRYEHHYTPEEIVSYIYAVLHAPAYRTRYSEFLRIDFPRVPFPQSADDFEKLSKLGWALVLAHLLRELPRSSIAKYDGKGDHMVEAVRYTPQDQAIWINKTQFFKPVSQVVWDFHIGGYQVLDKYLKSRKGRKLSLDEINHVPTVVDSLAFTIEQMAKIDKAYQVAFPDRG